MYYDQMTLHRRKHVHSNELSIYFLPALARDFVRVEKTKENSLCFLNLIENHLVAYATNSIKIHPSIRIYNISMILNSFI